MNDPISDMIIRIKNAAASRKKSVSFPYSKIKMALAEVLKNEGFLENVAKKGKKVKKTVEVDISYTPDGKRPKITGVQRMSKFSRRMYIKASDIRLSKIKRAKAILSTSKGIMTEAEAKKSNVGGELLFKVW